MSSPAPSSEAGFTMIELIVVVMLMAIIMMGLFSLQDALLQQRGRILRNIAVRNQNDLARRVMLRELASATVVLEPRVGMASDEIIGWKNLDPSTIVCCGTTTHACLSCKPFSTNVRTDLGVRTACGPTVAAPHGCGSDGVETPRPLSTTGGGDESQIQWFRFCLDTTLTDDANPPETPRLIYYRGTGFDNTGALPAEATEICGDSALSDTIQSIGGFDGITIEKTSASVFNRTRHNWVDIDFAATVERPVPSTGKADTAKAETHVGVTLMTGNLASVGW